MIRAKSSFNGPPLEFAATVGGLAVYLDNWAIIELAKGDPSRRMRFVDAIRAGGADLMFSVANAAELSGPQGKSADVVKSFLNEIGPHWFPVELDTVEVMRREKARGSVDECCVSEGLIRAYFHSRTSSYSPGSGKIISLCDDFFCLGAFLDWLGPQHESISNTSKKFDEVLKTEISARRRDFDLNPSLLDKLAIQFHGSRPATFAFYNLVRTLIREAKAHQLKAGDAMDFSHAVMGSAFGSIAALDKHWKRRVEGLPKPNNLANIYGPLDLDKMVTDLWTLLEQRKSPSPVPSVA